MHAVMLYITYKEEKGKKLQGHFFCNGHYSMRRFFLAEVQLRYEI